MSTKWLLKVAAASILLISLSLYIVNQSIYNSLSDNVSPNMGHTEQILEFSHYNYKPSKCLFIWNKKRFHCNVAGLKSAIGYMVSKNILEAIYRNCSYLILDESVHLTHSHDIINNENISINNNYQYNLSEWYNLSNIQITNNQNNNAAVNINIILSNSFEFINLINNKNTMLIIDNKYELNCNYPMKINWNKIDKDDFNSYSLIKSSPRTVCHPRLHDTCKQYWTNYKVYIPFSFNILNISYFTIKKMISEYNKYNNNNYCWITLMIRRGDKLKQYALPHQFGIKYEGIVIIINYLIKYFCSNTSTTSKIAYIAIEPSSDSNMYISNITNNFIDTDINILNYKNLCTRKYNYTIANLCANNYILFLFERLLLFHSNINFIEASKKYAANSSNIYFKTEDIELNITNGSVWFHPASGYKKSRKWQPKSHPKEIVFTTTNDLNIYLKYTDMIENYLSMDNHRENIKEFALKWNTTITNFTSK